MNIALCIIATGKYGRFVEPLIDSANRFFLQGHRVRYHVFVDQEMNYDDPREHIHWWPTIHRPWPGPTLYRYHTMYEVRDVLGKFDFVFYIDADMRFVAPVGSEILPKEPGLVGTLHPGYCGTPPSHLPYERRPESAAYIGPLCGEKYYAGGFQGGTAKNFIRAMGCMADLIEDDMDRRITAVWHDESHWNRYLFEHPPAIELPPQYCCPETWPMDGRKLLALDKNHAEMRA